MSGLVRISGGTAASTLPWVLEGAAREATYRTQLDDFARNPAVMMELSSLCNYHCDYCRSPISDRQKSYMDRKLFNHILPQLAGFTERRLRLHIDGEPMLHPEFLDIALAANRAGHRLAIASNASRLGNEMLPVAMDLYVHLSTSAEEHSRRSPANFGAYVEKIRKYCQGWIEGSSDQNIHLKIYFNGLESTNEELMRAKRDFLTEFTAGFGQVWTENFTCRNSSGKELKIFFQQTTEGGLYPDISGFVKPCDLPRDRGFCDSPWKIMGIHSDGAVGFCCVDITGKTIFTQPEEIWDKPLSWIWQQHPGIHEARDQFLAGRVDLPICRDCLDTSPNRESYLFTEIFPGDPNG